MTVFDLGQYRVQQLNQGFKVSWQEGSIRHHMMLNIEELITNHINSHLATILSIIILFDRQPEALLEMEAGKKVIDYIPPTNTVPGIEIPPHLVREWHHRQLVSGYNRVFNTDFTYEMIRNRL